MIKYKHLKSLIFFLIILSLFTYGCGKKADPIPQPKKTISTKN